MTEVAKELDKFFVIVKDVGRIVPDKIAVTAEEYANIQSFLSLELRKAYQKGYVKGKNSQMADNISLIREMSELKTQISLELEKQDIKSRISELQELALSELGDDTKDDIYYKYIKPRLNSLSQSPVESSKNTHKL